MEIIETPQATIIETSPSELREQPALKSMSQFREEMHKALTKFGIDAEYIVKNYKDVIEDNPQTKPSDILKALELIGKMRGDFAPIEVQTDNKLTLENIIRAATTQEVIDISRNEVEVEEEPEDSDIEQLLEGADEDETEEQ